jgi:dihydrofolate synthase/folylpolyglutamate synthase
MNYQESLEFVNQFKGFAKDTTLERIEKLLELLDNPHTKFKSIHVTGTNGKGSVTAMISNILMASDLKVGRFTSPHLVNINERIEINNQEISNEDFALAISAIAAVVDKVEEIVGEKPTQFEILTAAAFLHFSLTKVDYAVIEVGLGGLWDSTNVLVPEVSVITNVAMDHMKQCGDTLEKIAMQKAGIIKEKVPVVSGVKIALAGPIQALCMFKQSRLYSLGHAFDVKEVKSSIEEGTTFTLSAGEYHSDYSIKLLGEHQISNAALAVVAAKVVSKKDNRIHEVALHQGVAHTFWPGRIERVKENPDVILDGAHNPSGAKALRAALNKYYPNKRVSFILGFMKDKEVEKILKELLTVKDRVFAVKADDSERALASEKVANKADVAMADLTHSFQTAKAFKDLESAFTSAEESTAKDDIICVCGSLYLVGAFKAWQLKNK